MVYLRTNPTNCSVFFCWQEKLEALAESQYAARVLCDFCTDFDRANHARLHIELVAVEEVKND